MLAYENKLKYLLKHKGTIPQVMAQLKKVITHFRNKRTFRYLRLWLYLATFSKRPNSIYQHLMDNNIGSTYALLYQDVCYHYYALNRKDQAQAILIKGIELKAQPVDDLQRTLWNLERGIHYTAPPSMAVNSLKVRQLQRQRRRRRRQQQQLPLSIIGLGSTGTYGVLNTMGLYIQKTARIALFNECKHGTYSCEELHARSLDSKATAAFNHILRNPHQRSHHPQYFVRSDRNIRPQKITPRRPLQPISKHNQNIGKKLQHDQNNKGKHQQRQYDHPQVAHKKLSRLLQDADENHDKDHSIIELDHHPKNQKDKEAPNDDKNQQPQDDDRHLQRIPVNSRRLTIFTIPLRFEYKQSLVVPQVINATTHDLVQSYKPNCLHSLNRKQRVRAPKKEITLDLNQQKIQCLELLGAGKYGSVYRIKWNNQLMARKVQQTPDRWDHYMLQFIHQKCPDAYRYVIQSYALYLNQQTSFMIMDYSAKGTLWGCFLLFRENGMKTMSEPLVQLLMLRLLQGIVVLHSARVMHMDIKLDNIMMDYSSVDNSIPIATTYLKKRPPPYTPDDPYWNKISIKLIDFGLAVNLNLISPSTPATTEQSPPRLLARATWKGTKKCDMPAIASQSDWPPHHLDYWCVANCAHVLLFSGDIQHGLPHRPQRNWNTLFWASFFKILVTSPAPCLEDGIRDLKTLITDLELSMGNSNVINEAVHQLYLYDSFYSKKK